MALPVGQYSLNHLPEGISYNAHTREMMVPITCADHGEVVLLEPNFNPTREIIVGKWSVCPDNIHLQHGDIVRRISDVAEEFAYKHCAFKIIAFNQRAEYRENELKMHGKKMTLAKISVMLLIMTALVVCILVSTYYIHISQL